MAVQEEANSSRFTQTQFIGLPFYRRFRSLPHSLTDSKAELLSQIGGIMGEEMAVNYMADEIASDARHYYPQDRELAKDLSSHIERYPSEKSALIAHFIKTNLISRHRAMTGHMRYWLDPEKWRSLLSTRSQRDNVVVVIDELINLDLNLSGCMDNACFQSLSSRASFLLKMWRTDTIPNIAAFLSYWEPSDRIINYFHNVTHFIWLDNVSKRLLEEMRHKMYRPGSVGEKRAREDFEECLGDS